MSFLYPKMLWGLFAVLMPLLIHFFPKDYVAEKDRYVDKVCETILPKLASRVDFVDVFCDDLAFSLKQTEKIARKAQDLGKRIRLHVDQFPSQTNKESGTQLGVRLGAVSVDHLEYVTEDGMRALGQSNTVGVLLPWTSFTLKETYANASRLLEMGCDIALGTNTNPGTSLVTSMPMVMMLAVKYMGMPIEAIYDSVTRLSAKALDLDSDYGVLEVGKKADLLVWPKPYKTVSDIPYYASLFQGPDLILKHGNVSVLRDKTLEVRPFFSIQKQVLQTLSLDASRQRVLTFLYEKISFSEQGLITSYPEMPVIETSISRAPKRTVVLTEEEKEIAIKTALNYFDPALRDRLREEFSSELSDYGHIYMFRYAPDCDLFALPFSDLKGNCPQTRAIQHMILNNLDPSVAQFPFELITYGFGKVFNNWGQFHHTIRFLSIMSDAQTLSLLSGHPQGLFPSSTTAARLVITNGMMIPNYSSKKNLDRLSAQLATMYGQMTAGSFMYIGPQGIVHGTNQVVSIESSIHDPTHPSMAGKVFVSSGLGGMSGAQPKAVKILGGVALIAEVNKHALDKRQDQGWLDESYHELDSLLSRAKDAVSKKEAVSLGFYGNIVDLLVFLGQSDLKVDLISDQTSLHNPYQGGYIPQGLSLDEAERMMVADPDGYQRRVQASLVSHVIAINHLVHRDAARFFDYGNAFLLEAERANAPLLPHYQSYVESSMGPYLFDFGFGPFRWVCTSGDEADLALTDRLAAECIEQFLNEGDPDIAHQLNSNLEWVKSAKDNQLVVGSQARILYSDLRGRIAIALAFNKAVREGRICAPIVMGRDHHDVSGTDSPYRETADIKDGTQFTADMSIQNVIGDAMRSATWVSIHNGGGVGWGEVTNGGFGLVLDGSEQADRAIEQMLFFDVANGLVRRARAGHENAIKTVKKLEKRYPNFLALFK